MAKRRKPKGASRVVSPGAAKTGTRFAGSGAFPAWTGSSSSGSATRCSTPRFTVTTRTPRR